MSVAERWIWGVSGGLASVAIAVSWIREEIQIHRIRREHSQRLQDIRDQATGAQP